MSEIVPVNIKGVYIIETLRGPTPVVLLVDDKDRIMPIYIGLSEAISIHTALRNEVAPRPMTHDLFISLLDRLNSKIINILIDELNDGIYYARLTISFNGNQFELDARPSDCLALALRAKAPVQVRESVMKDAVVSKEELEGILTIDNYL